MHDDHESDRVPALDNAEGIQERVVDSQLTFRLS